MAFAHLYEKYAEPQSASEGVKGRRGALGMIRPLSGLKVLGRTLINLPGNRPERAGAPIGRAPHRIVRTAPFRDEASRIFLCYKNSFLI